MSNKNRSGNKPATCDRSENKTLHARYGMTPLPTTMIPTSSSRFLLSPSHMEIQDAPKHPTCTLLWLMTRVSYFSSRSAYICEMCFDVERIERCVLLNKKEWVLGQVLFATTRCKELAI